MSNNGYKILLVDDEEDILEIMQYNLLKEGFEVATANNGIECISIAAKFNPDLILMDIMMPEMDGIVTCEELRKIDSLKNVLVCFLTARSEDYSQIAGYDVGGDDYIIKPIKPRILVSKINALLRRTEQEQSTAESEVIKSIKIDRDRYVVLLRGKELTLPKKEFELLDLLVSGNGNVLRREVILKEVWGEEIIVGDRTIDVHIRKLREKIGDDFIKTVKGVGYKFVDQ
ncbi:MAG: two-component system alkaline phosphatase synthesis response regulator PhoP [Flavobacteriales bacterium]|jgi:two-component system alkaline phosphatase synthesis response regulator PhoP